MPASSDLDAEPSPPPSPSDRPDDASGGPGGTDGVRVVLLLFVVLALGVVGAFALFYGSTRPADRDFIVPVVLRDLYLPVVATGLLVAIDARGRGRSGWWLYLVAAPVPVVNVVLAAAWLLRWRRAEAPPRVGRWEL